MKPIASDMSSRKALISLGVFLALIVGLALLPQVATPYLITVMIPAVSYGIAMLGFNLLFGSAGLLSFGHSMFLGVGAYAAAYLTTAAGIRSMEIILLVAILAGVVFSFVVGSLSVRYTHIFFGILTLAFGMLFHSFLFKFYDITSGDQGIRVLRPTLLGQTWDVSTTEFLTGPFYYYALVIYAVLGVAIWKLRESAFGLHLRATRENPNKAAYVGVKVYPLRLWAFVISGVCCSIAGVLMGVTTGLADPEIAYWTQSGNLIFMAVMGGSGTFAGPAYGALLFVLLHDIVNAVTPYWRFLLGSVLVFFVLFLPKGLGGTLDEFMANWRRRT